MSMQAEEQAKSVLDTFFDGNPRTFPVDPVVVARSLGINVWRGTFDNSISGALIKAKPESGVDLFINESHAPVRQRFTTAHELGHYFSVQSDPERAKGPYMFERGPLASCGTDRDEIYANAFAAALLAPADEVKRLAKIGMPAHAMAARFQISLDAMNIRLSNVVGKG